MRKYLVILFFLINGFALFSQEVNHRVKFVYGLTAAWPCDDGVNDYYYYKTAVNYNCTITVTEPLSATNDTTYNVNYGSIKNYTCSEIEVTISGSATITWERLGPGQTHGEGTYSYETVSFNEISETVIFEIYNYSCDTKSIPLISDVVETCSNSFERIHVLNLMLDIMPYLPLDLGGSKVCTGDEIILKSLETQPEHDWYAIINGKEWFSLDLDQAIDTTTAEYIYSKAPEIQVIDDSRIPPRYYDVPVKFMPGDQIQFIVDHGCYGFDFGDNPLFA